MAKKKCIKSCPDCPKCLPNWLAAFGDLMSLLLVFFVLLLSMAVFDKPKVEEYFEVMRKSMGILEQSAEAMDSAARTGPAVESEDAVEEDSDDLKEEIKEEVEAVNSSSSTKVDQAVFTDGESEFIVEIPSSLLFKAGEYNITNRKGKIFVKKLARIIRTMTADFTVEVIGHTDRSSFRSSKIPRNNWDMSALRSIAVITELMKNKIDPSILKLAGFAQYRPKGGIASQNRRVELRFFAEKNKGPSLSGDNFFERMKE
jgi:chemotaxis protein MotB